MTENRFYPYFRYNDFLGERNSVLVTDVLFPTRYAMWRIAETTSFILEKSADVMVFRHDRFAGFHLGVDYAEMMFEQGFADYNILIFDQNYNHLNQFNTRVDGTRYNGKFRASYLITRHEVFDIKRYSLVYHIFLTCYAQFNQAVYFQKRKQAIHLYPGGGYPRKNALTVLSKKTKVISTHPRTSAELNEIGHTNYIELLGGTFFTKEDGPIHPKPINNGVLKVGFASMGHAAEKGAADFVMLSKVYKEKHPESRVEFISIGKDALHPDVTHLGPMPMRDLFSFYRTELDVMVSLDTGLAYNGWPLGSEAALAGAVLATTDPQNARGAYGLTENSIFYIEPRNLNHLVEFISALDRDRSKLQSRSIACQSEIGNLLSYQNQQAKIFDFIGI